MNIITVSREFSSGGREVGKRLADELGYVYIDKEIVSAVAERSKMDEKYIAGLLEHGEDQTISLTFGRSFSYSYAFNDNFNKVLSVHNEIIKEIARNNNCVIVGRGADIFLEEFKPLNLFVYSSLENKISRCQKRDPDAPLKEIKRKIKKIDKGRKKFHEMLGDFMWGKKEHYHLCINTTGMNIKEVSKSVAGFARSYFDGNK